MAEQVKVQEWMETAEVEIADFVHHNGPQDRPYGVIAGIIARHSPSDEVERLRAIVERLYGWMLDVAKQPERLMNPELDAMEEIGAEAEAALSSHQGETKA